MIHDDKIVSKVKEHVSEADLLAREIDHVDIALDKFPEKSYKENEVNGM